MQLGRYCLVMATCLLSTGCNIRRCPSFPVEQKRIRPGELRVAAPIILVIKTVSTEPTPTEVNLGETLGKMRLVMTKGVTENVIRGHGMGSTIEFYFFSNA